MKANLIRNLTVLAITLTACDKKWSSVYQPLDFKRAGSVSGLIPVLDSRISPPVNISPVDLRWTEGDSDAPAATLEGVLAAVHARTGVLFTSADFKLSEDRMLANSKYVRFVQLKDGEIVRNRSVRIWSNVVSEGLVQAEAFLDRPVSADNLGLAAVRRLAQTLPTSELMARAKELLSQQTEDISPRGIATSTEWRGHVLITRIEIRGRHGRHDFLFAADTGRFLEHSYHGFLDSDLGSGQSDNSEYSLPGKIFPIWEFPEGQPNDVTDVIATSITNLQSTVHVGTDKSYESMGAQRYFYNKYDADIGNTAEGRTQGFWNNEFIRNAVANIFDALPLSSNLPIGNAVSRIVGRYAGIFLHPEAVAHFPDLSFHPDPSPQFYLKWESLPDTNDDWEGKPNSLTYGKPVASVKDLLNRDPFNSDGHSDNTPQTLINSGFDEVQVYSGITYLFETLHVLGFSDPELSTRPIAAVLFDPSLDSKDNAFYDNDTINFSTYSPGALNYARDNTTIWHELGHGIMDRLMGAHLNFADTGGLSEGMADFVAQLVVNARTHGQDFPGFHTMRIFNKTAFHMTNEVHDDGEAYGGAMNDILTNAVVAFGFDEGLKRVADLVLETMRLTRDHPALTAEVWFERMIFADSLEREIPMVARHPGEMRQQIITALASRNFSLAAGDVPANFVLRNDESEIGSDSLGSRNNPLAVEMGPLETRVFNLSAELDLGSFLAFQFPLKVRVMFEGGPLQGAANWVGQEDRYIDTTIESPNQLVSIPVTLRGTCDFVNRDQGGCKDFIYVQIWNHGETEYPVAKKRFYIVLKTA